MKIVLKIRKICRNSSGWMSLVSVGYFMIYRSLLMAICVLQTFSYVLRFNYNLSLRHV